MANRAVNRANAEAVEAVEADVRRLMIERGLTRDAAELVVAVERGYAFVGDREEVPPGCRETILAEEEAAEQASFARNSPRS